MDQIDQCKKKTVNQLHYEKYKDLFKQCQKNYYNSNTDVIKEKVRNRYNNDEEYRKKKLEAMALYRAKKKAEKKRLLEAEKVEENVLYRQVIIQN